MSDDTQEPATGSITGAGAVTGHAGVDEVIAGLDGLARLPLSAHVEVLERAHERLRAALSDGPETGRAGSSVGG